MSLFDYLRVDAPLPDGKPTPPDLFQTKDFPTPYMDRYTITAAGRLIAHRTDYCWKEDGDAPLGYWLICHPIGDEDLNWHGYLHFGSYDPVTKERREFRAKFTDGQLVGIVDLREADPNGGEKANAS